jgi:hypothetical protein
MAFKIVSEAEVVGWDGICKTLCQRFPHLESIFAPIASDVKAAEVLRVRFPYGTGLIHEGRFCWDTLPERHRGWADDYGDINIPLCLVTRRCIELREEAPFGDHSIPLYLLTEGELFGLFQTFCDNLPQKRLQATAGGTSLILLPRIGNRDKLKGLVRAEYESLQKDSWHSPWNGYADAHLKADNSSGFYFGEFFRDFLYQKPSMWRAEVILFPKCFVDAITQNHESHLAAVKTAITYLRRSYERSEQTIELISDDSEGNSGHVLALRMIRHGLRPGFAPVFGVDKDETVLPAEDIYSLFYGDNASFRGIAEFYPALFRPSLPEETSFYFLNWPYVEFRQSKKDNKPSVVERTVRKAKMVEVGHTRSNLFEQLEPSSFGESMQIVAPADAPHEVRMPGKPEKNYFLKGGVIMVRPSEVSTDQ